MEVTGFGEVTVVERKYQIVSLFVGSNNRGAWLR